MKLISASRRTDIPAFYSRWFLNRVAEGFCEWVNPFNGQVQRVSLAPEDVAGIVCWTRNPKPLIPSLDALERRGYALAFHCTINGYPRELESHNPPVDSALQAFRELAARLPADRAWWRYDPILLTEATPTGWHLRNFSNLARALEGASRRCYFSFTSFYRKTRRNLANCGLAWHEPGIGEKLDLTSQLTRTAREHGIRMLACCDDSLLASGAGKARCVYAGGFKAAPSRPECGCVESVDIGAYDTCPFGCVYCYATQSRRAALVRLGAHDPRDTALWRPATTAGRPGAAPAPAAGEEPEAPPAGG